jgi:hypothetical protein
MRKGKRTNLLFEETARATTPVDPLRMNPERLRERVQAAVWRLEPPEQESIRDQIVRGFEEVGVNLKSALVMMGLTANEPAELTPPELAMVVRYVRLNWPVAMESVREALMELLTKSSLETRKRAA